MGKLFRTTPLLLVFAVVLALGVSLASAGGLTKLDSGKEKSNDVGIGLSGSATPAKKFILKVRGTKGVKVAAGGVMSCAKKSNPSKGVGGDIRFSRKIPFKKAIPPSTKKNSSCSMSVSLNTDNFKRKITVKAKLFHKG